MPLRWQILMFDLVGLRHVMCGRTVNDEFTAACKDRRIVCNQIPDRGPAGDGKRDVPPFYHVKSSARDNRPD